MNAPSTNAAASSAPRVQYGPNGEVVTVVKSKTTQARGFKVVSKTKGTYVVPLELAALCVGRDSWMKKLTARCNDCGALTPCGDLEGWGLCPDCYEKTAAEFDD